MATILDAGLIGQFDSLFVFLFVLVSVYAFLLTIKMFGENHAIKAVIAFIFAILFASSSYVTGMFKYAIPWLVFIFMLIIIVELATKFMGAEKVFSFGSSTTAITIVIVFIGVVFAISAGQVSREKTQQLVDQGVLQEGENKILSFPEKVGETLRQPAFLGLIAVMLIAIFSIMLLSHQATK